MRELEESYGYTAHVPTLGEKKADKQGMSGYRARRWVVERTHFWMNHFRRGLIRWEKDVEN